MNVWAFARGWRPAAVAVALVLALSAPSHANTDSQSADARLVEISLDGDRFMPLPGATQVVVLEDSICRAEIAPGGVRIHGLARGESILFVWTGPSRVALLVRVVLPAPPPARHEMSPEQRVQAGEGQLATIGQVVPIGGELAYAFQDRFDWAQQVDGRRIALFGQATHGSLAGAPFNLAAVSLQYSTPRSSVALLDFSLGVNGSADARIPGVSPFNAFALRGADVSITRGATRVELFGGTTVPTYFRSLDGTRSMAGVNLERRQSTRLTLFATTAAIGVPPPSGSGQRQTSAFQTAGLTYRFGDLWAAQATGGASTRGLYADSAFTFVGNRFSTLLSAVASAPEFPLNQLQLLATGASAIRAASSWRVASRLTTSMSFQHSVTKAAPLVSSLEGRSDYFNPTVALALPRSQSVVVNGLLTENRTGKSAERTDVRRLDLGWTSQWFGRATNNLRITGSQFIGTAADRSIDLGFVDNVNVRLGKGDLTVGYQNLRQDPSIVSRLRQQLGLLTVEQQQQFLADPAGFASSPNLPPEIAALVGELRSSDTEWSVGGQFQPTTKINLSLNYRFLRSAPTPLDALHTRALGYVLTYRVTPAWQVYSSITDTLALDARTRDLTRSSVLMVGLTRTFHGAPSWLTPSVNQRTVRGRLFVDRNINGIDDDGEAGLKGRTVVLDNGRRALTDAAGRFQFTNVAAGSHRVTLALDQFQEPIRVTTPSSVDVDMAGQSTALVGFGVVNFSRVMGAVFNDYRLDGTRHADSPGLPRVGVIITGGDGSVVRRIETDGSGEYRVDDLDPGTYRLDVDRATIPSNYVVSAARGTFEVLPTRTVVCDVALLALRSVSGHVYWSAAGANNQNAEQPEPLSGVLVVAGRSRAVTDASGYFMLRDLPAGDVTVTVVPAKPLPDGLAPPVGRLQMPYEPTQIDGASVVIRRRELVDYLKQQ